MKKSARALGSDQRADTAGSRSSVAAVSATEM
jgi:hypothetical protein